MSFCPSCGVQFEGIQSFCRNCGYDLRRALGTADAQPVTPLDPVYGLDGRNVFVIGDGGVTRVGAGPWIYYLPIIGLVAVAQLLGIVFPDVRPIPVSLALILACFPIVNKLRHRWTNGRLALSKDELQASKGAAFVSWEALSFMSIEVRTLRYGFGKDRYTMAIESADVPSVSAKAAATLGARFRLMPGKRRLSGPVKFLILTLLLFVITQLILIFASVTPFYPGEEARYSLLVNSTEGSFTGAPIVNQFGLIFFNNIQVALFSAIPGLGMVTLSAASYNTGRAIQVIAMQNGVSPYYFLTVLYLLPHSWVEELSYPLAGALTFYGILEWRRTSYKEFSVWWKRDRFSVGFGVIALILAVAAVLEVSEPPLEGYALFLWGPVLIGGGYLYSRFRGRLKEFL